MFGIRRSIRYHSKRQAYFEFADRFASFLLILLGSGVLLEALDGYRAGLGLGVAGLSSLKLIFVPGFKAGIHAQFVKDFTRLEKELSHTRSTAVVRKVTALRLDLESTEPPVLRVLDAICHNELLRAMDIKDPKEYARITWFQRLTARVFSWRSHLVKKGQCHGA